MEWQPIETAPKDGTHFQAWLTDGRSGRNVLQHWEPLCRFNPDGAFEIWGRIDYDMDGWKTDWNPDWKPTHWMPLPQPPALIEALQAAARETCADAAAEITRLRAQVEAADELAAALGLIANGDKLPVVDARKSLVLVQKVASTALATYQQAKEGGE